MEKLRACRAQTVVIRRANRLLLSQNGDYTHYALLLLYYDIYHYYHTTTVVVATYRVYSTVVLI